jgi:glutathione synthase/RimK-type ligase-like ATP-grasp enzyme
MSTTALCDVAVLTDDRFEHLASPDWYQSQLLLEEQLLVSALGAHGLVAKRISWSNPGIDWSQVRSAVFRSTWDYFERFAHFSSWVAQAERQTRLINNGALIRWNWDKRYLADLAAAGIAIPPTRFLAAGTRTTLAAELSASGWRQAILKPAVSGGARNTFLVDAGDAAAHQGRFAALIGEQAMLLQEFLPSIMSAGEVSVMVIGGRCTHAVRKRAKDGDFRVQDDHGGTVSPIALEQDMVAYAESVIGACPQPPVYARVDALTTADRGYALMELELIEPELFLRFHPPAADALALAIAGALGG